MIAWWNEGGVPRLRLPEDRGALWRPTNLTALHPEAGFHADLASPA
jgi:hypothetical protein